MTTPTRDGVPMSGDDVRRAVHVPDELELAYRQAVEVDGDDAPRPAPRVRSAVLAAARAVADEARLEEQRAPARPAALPPESAAPSAGLGRVPAANRPSWRLRAGAAACVVVLTGVASWQFYEASRARDQQVASAAPESPIRILPGDQPSYAPQGLPAAAPALPLPPLPADSAPVAARARAAMPVPTPTAPPVAVAQADALDPAKPAPEAAKRAEPSGNIVVAEAAAPALNVPPAPVNAPPAPMNAPPPPAAPVPPTRESVAVAAATREGGADATRDLRARESKAAAQPGVADSLLKSAGAPAEPAATGALSSVATRADGAARGAAAARPARVPTVAPTPVPLPPLQRAADAGDAAGIARLLAQPGAAVDEPDADGRTALLHAVLAHRHDAVRALLAAGADPARTDRFGLTPRTAAQQSGDADLATLLAPR